MECPLCLDFYSDEPGDYFVATANGHIFHNQCLALWKEKGEEGSSTCPTCRQCLIQNTDLIRLRNVDPTKPTQKSEKSPYAVVNENTLASQISELSISAPSDIVVSEEVITPSEFSLLSHAIRCHPEATEFWIHIRIRNVMVDITDVTTGQNAAHICAKFGRLDIMRGLDDAGVNLELYDNFGKTPFDYAFEKGDEQMMEYLLNLQKPTRSRSKKHIRPSWTRRTTDSESIENYRQTWSTNNPSVKFSKCFTLTSSSSEFRVRVEGKLTSFPDEFAINIIERQNILLHFNPQLKSGIIYMSSWQQHKKTQGWTKWKVYKLSPTLLPGKEFVIEIVFNNFHDQFWISVNDEDPIVYKNMIEPAISEKRVVKFDKTTENDVEFQSLTFVELQ